MAFLSNLPTIEETNLLLMQLFNSSTIYFLGHLT
jgi:hypothetical protein